MNKVDIFLNKLENLCNYNEKWLELILQDFNNREDIFNCSLNKNILVMEKSRKDILEELDNYNVTEGYPIYEKIIISLEENKVKYRKFTKADHPRFGTKRFTKTSMIDVTKSDVINYYYNEHSNTTYLPWINAKPANKITDTILEERYDNDNILQATTKKVVETIDPNDKYKNHEYDIIKTNYEPIPYEDPNRNTYVSVTTETSSLHRGKKYYNIENNWYENLDKNKKTFICGEKALDIAIKEGLIKTYKLKGKSY